MKTMIISAAMAITAFLSTGELIGRWETKPSSKGNITGVLFKSDNSFEGYINKKPFTSGTYTFHDNIFSLADNGCQGLKGIYKIRFFSDSDSLRFEVIKDSCTGRREGMSRLVLGRVK